MKLSSKGRYAIQAMFDLAFHSEGQAAQVKDICERQRIPPRFLEQVFQDLRKAGLVRSKRGPRGGYQLACPASDIRLGDVIRAAQGPLSLVQDLAPEEADVASTSSMQVMQHVLRDMSERIDACLNAVTLEDMCTHAHTYGIANQEEAPYVYSI